MIPIIDVQDSSDHNRRCRHRLPQIQHARMHNGIILVTGMDSACIEGKGVRGYCGTAEVKFGAIPARSARLYGTIRYLSV